ncbi:hypothetical protein HRbin16_01545 [bacterium HR16]|nr:hypothetical protein HRbin16_01545 [bacterium HR16]
MQSLVSRDLLTDELEALVRAGYYPSTEEAIQHAIEVLLTANPLLRRGVAVDLLRRGKVTLSRAAEIAGTDMETFKQYLAQAEVVVEVDEPTEEVVAGARQIQQVRDSNA